MIDTKKRNEIESTRLGAELFVVAVRLKRASFGQHLADAVVPRSQNVLTNVTLGSTG